jgi:type IV fimbrial biogenesis protein FimT
VKRASGFTLFEMMVALAMVGILVVLAAPGFREFTRNNQVTAVNNDLVTALNLARSEAGRRSTPVAICPSADGITCGNLGDWRSGWIVFQDSAAAGAIASPDDVVQKWTESSGVLQLAADSAVVRYQPLGTLDGANPIGFDVSYVGCRGSNLRHVQVALIGTISTQLQPCH